MVINLKKAAKDAPAHSNGMAVPWLNSPKNVAQFKEDIKKSSGPMKTHYVPVVTETDAELEKLPIWQRTGTTKVAPTYTSFGYGILPKQSIKDASIKRHCEFAKTFDLLAKLFGGRQGGWTALFLRNVDYWYHRSTDGRRNEETGRWERHWVAPVADVLTLAHYIVSERTCLRIRNRLVSEGLIEVETHAKAIAGVPTNYLWIKPTDLLERLIFDDDFWADFRNAAMSSPSTGKKSKSPRGLPVVIAEKRKDLKFALGDGWYTRSIGEKMALFDECSTPVDAAGNGKRPYRMRPYFSTRGPSFRTKIYLRIAEDMKQEANPIPTAWLDWMKSRLPPHTLNPFEGYPAP